MTCTLSKVCCIFYAKIHYCCKSTLIVLCHCSVLCSLMFLHAAQFLGHKIFNQLMVVWLINYLIAKLYSPTKNAIWKSPPVTDHPDMFSCWHYCYSQSAFWYCYRQNGIIKAINYNNCSLPSHFYNFVPYILLSSFYWRRSFYYKIHAVHQAGPLVPSPFSIHKWQQSLIILLFGDTTASLSQCQHACTSWQTAEYFAINKYILHNKQPKVNHTM